MQLVPRSVDCHASDRKAACERTALALALAPVGLLTIDAEGHIVEANRQIELLFGYNQQEMVGARVEMMLPERHREMHVALRETYARHGPTPRVMGTGRSLSGRRKDGSEFPVEIGLSPLVTSTGTFVLAAVTDISERQEREARELEARSVQFQAHRREMTLLGEMSSLLQHAVNEAEVSDVIVAYGVQLFPGSVVGVYMLPNSRTGLRLVASWGGFNGATELGLQACWAVRRAQLHGWSQGKAARCTHHPSDSRLTHICIPMAAHGNVIGVAVFAGDARAAAGWEVLGRSVADQLGLALSNLQLRERLHNMSIRDPLTNLFNRRYLEETMAREIPRARDNEIPICVLMIDFDHFKDFNDTHGHQGGDEALRLGGRAILSSIRPEDVACRYGGEEFVVVLPGASLESGVRRAEEIRSVVHRDTQPKVTLSIGVSVFPVHGESWDELFRSADLALYEAKHEGRDRVAVATDPRESRRP